MKTIETHARAFFKVIIFSIGGVYLSLLIISQMQKKTLLTNKNFVFLFNFWKLKKKWWNSCFVKLVKTRAEHDFFFTSRWNGGIFGKQRSQLKFWFWILWKMKQINEFKTLMVHPVWNLNLPSQLNSWSGLIEVLIKFQFQWYIIGIGVFS